MGGISDEYFLYYSENFAHFTCSRLSAFISGNCKLKV